MTIGYLNVPAVPAFQTVNVTGQIVLPAVPPSLLAGNTDFTLSMIPDADYVTDPTYPHEATQGRDQYVKVVNKGFLFPFGHQVSIVQVTQRDHNGGYLGTRIARIREMTEADPGLVWLNQYANPANAQAHARRTATSCRSQSSANSALPASRVATTASTSASPRRRP